MSSRLLEYEVLNRLHVRSISGAAFEVAVSLIKSMYLLDLAPDVLARARDPFPIAVRTLDGLHLASLTHLRRTEPLVRLASYDRRMRDAAIALGITWFEP